MNKHIILLLTALTLPFLGGCSKVGDRSSSISVVYLVAAILSLLFLLCCIFLFKKKEPWLLLLFSSVLVINIGYYALSVSQTLEAALWANRVSYLGSTVLPISMLMIILKVAGIKAPRWLPYVLMGIAACIFLVAASPGMLDIYYKEVSLGTYNGATVLEKVYGPLHPLNLFYLLGYTVVTAVIATNTAAKRELISGIKTFVLVASVFINIGVWLLEQFVRIDFELLSLSYIMSELFLLCLFLMIRDGDDQNVEEPVTAEYEKQEQIPTQKERENETFVTFKDGLSKLTPTEKVIYGYYLEKKTTKEIMAILNITENTLKYHNKNLYSKLGVSSRKRLIEIAEELDK
ncbi:MAG: hypothetical protein E7647_00780 [Ruminococcaceae bacterium]|nr:hypothetical protein [Oscillospiraceae bacterium]